MRLFRTFSLTGFFIFVSTLCTFAQGDSLARSEKYYKQGMDAFDLLHSKQAADFFLRSIRANPNNANAQLMAGKTFMVMSNKAKSLPYFMNAYALNPRIDEDLLFYIGQAYHYAEQFDSALLYYNRFNSLLTKSLQFQRSIKSNEVNHKIFECRNAMLFKSNPAAVEIVNLGSSINSAWPDYGPTVTADGSLMVFTSRRPDTTINEETPDDEFYEEIFVSRMTNNKEWTTSKNFGDPLTTSFHNASVSISPDGTEMFVYKDDNGGDIYETDRQPGNTWSKPKRLNGFINSPYLENSAATTSDKQTLFLVSDRPGGYGGTDIYTSVLNKRGEWGEVINLGSVINTDRDEEDVFISANGKHLFFSSNGHAGMGDFDIYRSTFDSTTQQWTEPLNLGYPINSVENDIYFVLTGDERYAYISSVRADSRGEEDIYRVDMQNWKPVSRSTLFAKETKDLHPTPVADLNSRSEKSTKIEKLKSVILDIDVVDDEQGSPLHAQVTFSRESEQPVQMKSLTTGKFVDTIRYQSNSRYQVVVESPGYAAQSTSFYLMGNNPGEKIHEVIALTKVSHNQRFVLNLFFDINKDAPNNKEELQLIESVLRGNPKLNMTIAGHTDSYGEESYNLLLSQKRVEAVKKILVGAGINPNRLRTIGYGETKPIADNRTSSGRRLNRRTEFVIVED